MSMLDCVRILVYEDLLTRQPLGIITDRDIVTRTVAGGRDPMLLVARDCMTTPPITIDEEAGVHECVDLLELAQIRRVLVVDATGACCGIVALADIATHTWKYTAGDLVREVSKPVVPAFA